MSLVHPQEVKQVPGRKSDVQDCQWLQKLHACGLPRVAFVPDQQTRVIREYMRQRQTLIEDAMRQIQRLQKVLDKMNVRVHHAVRDITGATGMRMLRAIAARR